MNWWRQLRQGGEEAVATAVPRRVLLIIYNPIIPFEGNRKLHQALGWHDPDELARQFIQDVYYASYGTAVYEIADRVEVDGLPMKADGFQYDAESFLFRWHTRTGFHQPDLADYPRILADFAVIPRINLGEIDEVWLFGPPYAGFYESIMAGPEAYWCNAPPLDGVGRCQRRFVIMGFNYERGAGEMLENLGHRVESIMAHVYRREKGAANLWQRFTRHEQSHPGQAECGTVHFAPNSERDYDWGNPRRVQSRCDDWLNFPDFEGLVREVDGRDWGGGDIRHHHLWWLRHLPRAAGTTGGIANNWWRYVVAP